MTSKVIYDWLSFTSKIHSPEEIILLLGLENCSFIVTNGAHGYAERLYYDNVSIHFNGRDDMGVWCELSGQGCRVFETFGNADYNSIFSLICSNTIEKNMKLTRLDIAYDDHDGILDILTVANDTLKSNYLSKSTEWEVTYTSKGTSVYIGSPSSLVRIRIYDKARERGLTDGSVWTRVELQLRDERAKLYSMLCGLPGENFCSVLFNYLRYVIPDENETNKSRLFTAEYWQKLINNALAQSIYEKPGTDYNLYQAEHYVYNQAGNPIDALIKIKGLDVFIEELKNRNTVSNPKYLKLISDNLKIKKELIE